MRRYRYPANYCADGEWSGTCSIGIGVLERCAHVLRRRSGATYARLLYIGAGHRRGPWGALALEINGHTYQFGGGMTRFPHLINNDRTLTESGERLLGTGIVGKVSVDTLEWHWLHDQCDLTFLLGYREINQLEAHWHALVNGNIQVPLFQTWPYTDKYKIPLRPDGLNCTRIQSRMIGPLIDMPDLDDDRPLRLFNKFLDLGFKFGMTGVRIPSPLDEPEELHNRWMLMSEQDIAKRLPDISPIDYRQIIKSLIELPESLLDWYCRGPY